MSEATIDGSHPQERGRKYIGKLVDTRIHRLHNGLAADQGSTKAAMASLRNALYAPPGSRPQLWELTAVPIPKDGRVGDGATWEEIALHLAMCLYARHQQSVSAFMHMPGVGLGEAVKRAEIATNATASEENADRQSAARRYFNAAATAVSVNELSRHLAGLVSLLRQSQVGLDYRMLAEDMYQFQLPGGPNAVRLRWARQHAKNIKQSN